MTETELFTYYESKFKPLYADLVVVLAGKPEQIAFEIEAAFSHLAVAHLNDDLYDKNIDKAYGHLQRASLDAVKIMWLTYKKRADSIARDIDLIRYASSVPDYEFRKKNKEAEEKLRIARHNETSNTGKDLSESIEQYYQVAHLYKELIDLIDGHLEKDYMRLKKKFLTKEVLYSFIVGFLSSGLISTIAWMA